MNHSVTLVLTPELHDKISDEAKREQQSVENYAQHLLASCMDSPISPRWMSYIRRLQSSSHVAVGDSWQGVAVVLSVPLIDRKGNVMAWLEPLAVRFEPSRVIKSLIAEIFNLDKEG